MNVTNTDALKQPSTKHDNSPLPGQLIKAYSLMCLANAMATIYDEQKHIATYVHSTSRGHEALQLAVGMQLQATDYVYPYYRDDSMLLGMGWTAEELMLQLLAKRDDPFSGGRCYYAHPSSTRQNLPKIPLQSSATGMQVIPATGAAQGIQYLNQNGLSGNGIDKNAIVVCSLGDGSVTEGEVAEAWQFAALHQLPILYIVQDNDWGISATAAETRSMDASQYAKGFVGLHYKSIEAHDFNEAWKNVHHAIHYVRTERKPMVLHAKVALLGHHTSGVRKEWYRSKDDLQAHAKRDPLPILRQFLLMHGNIPDEVLDEISNEAYTLATKAFKNATAAPEPDVADLDKFIFYPSPITEEKGERSPKNAKKVLMVDAALYAVEELLKAHPEALLYGQDVGGRLGGVFREAATLAQKFGNKRVFNTAIQEAYIVGSTAGMSAVGCKPIVEIQFADYFFPAMSQTVIELAKSCFLTQGKYPVQALIRVPVGAYGGGGPYHSACIESILLSVRGIKVVMPSNAADMKGLLKAAFYDPNPVIMLEHKGLYWSKVAHTSKAKTKEPSADYVIPLGKANTVLTASEQALQTGQTACIITYGMGVYWALEAAKNFDGRIEIIDLRSLHPIDETTIFASVKKHSRCLVLTEEQILNSFAEALAGRISRQCFTYLDAPVQYLGAKNLPAVPMNKQLEAAMLPNIQLVENTIQELLNY